MKTLKFRIWANGKMYNWGDKNWLLMSKSGFISFTDELEGSFNENTDNALAKDFQIMQYTGLRDKNGKEIYNGDIINIDKVHPIQGKRAVVEWQKWRPTNGWMRDKAGWMLKPLSKGLVPIWTEKTIKVIGNIHETPELLK